MSFKDTLLGGTGSRGDIWVNQGIRDAERTFGGRIAQAKMSALTQIRSIPDTCSNAVGSLHSLFPSSATSRLRDAGHVVSHQLCKGFSNAFKCMTAPLSARRIEIPEDLRAKHLDGVPLPSPKAVSVENSKRVFNERLQEGMFDKLDSFKEITNPNGSASALRVAYQNCQRELSGSAESVNSRVADADPTTQEKATKLKSYINGLSQSDKEKFLSLSPEELMALQMYTADSDYRLMNSILDGGVRNLETWVNQQLEKCTAGQEENLQDIDVQKLHDTFMHVANLVSSAINKLPKHEGIVYRSSWEEPSVINAYKTACENDKRMYSVSKKFVSTTEDKNVAENFDLAGDHQGRMQVIYKIEPSRGSPLNGADISRLSAKDGEGEVLLNRGSVFTVKGYEEVSPSVDEDGTKHRAHILVTLVQVPPDSIRENPNV